MNDFSFSIPQNIRVGAGSLKLLPDLAGELGKKKAYIISGHHLYRTGMVARCQEALDTAGIASECFTETEANPCTETVEKAKNGFLECGADFIVAFGGGSPLDVAKAVAVLVSFGGNYKFTISSPYLLPAYAILDPELIRTVPEKTAVACGVDAMVHAMEAYVSRAASPFSDMFAEKALKLIGANIRNYVADRTDQEACAAMLVGSLFAGIAFSHAKLGDVHAMSHPVSAFFDVPHGVANAILLPTVIDFNMSAAADKYYFIYSAITESPIEEKAFSPYMLGAEIRILNHQLGIASSLSEVGVKSDQFDAMAEDVMKSGNIFVNPRQTTKSDILDLYNQAF